jgi:hypothetical protein
MVESSRQAGKMWGEGITQEMMAACVEAFESMMPGDVFEFWMGPSEDVVLAVWLAVLRLAPKSSLQALSPEIYGPENPHRIALRRIR